MRCAVPAVFAVCCECCVLCSVLAWKVCTHQVSLSEHCAPTRIAHPPLHPPLPRCPQVFNHPILEGLGAVQGMGGQAATDFLQVTAGRLAFARLSYRPAPCCPATALARCPPTHPLFSRLPSMLTAGCRLCHGPG